MEWMLLPLKRYADFSGRSRRLEYWMFLLFQTILVTVLIIAGVAIAIASEPDGGIAAGSMIILVLLVLLGFFIPNLAVMVRRFHDQDKSGWFVLFTFLPYLGSLLLIIFMCMDGSKGANAYGPDPKDPDQSDVFA